MIGRVFSLVMMLLTLNVSVAEALRACARQEKHSAPQHQNCEKTEQPAPQSSSQCCAAMASCSFTLAIDGAADEERVIPDREVKIPGDYTLRSAAERTPEPPPPKS